MFKVFVGFISGVILVVPQTRHEVFQIGHNLFDLVGNLGTYLINLI